MTSEWVATDGRTVQLWWGGAGSSPCYVQDSLGNTIRHGEWSVPAGLLTLLEMLNAGDMHHALHARTLITQLLDGKPLEELKTH